MLFRRYSSDTLYTLVTLDEPSVYNDDESMSLQSDLKSSDISVLYTRNKTEFTIELTWKRLTKLEIKEILELINSQQSNDLAYLYDNNKWYYVYFDGGFDFVQDMVTKLYDLDATLISTGELNEE